MFLPKLKKGAFKKMPLIITPKTKIDDVHCIKNSINIEMDDFNRYSAIGLPKKIGNFKDVLYISDIKKDENGEYIWTGITKDMHYIDSAPCDITEFNGENEFQINPKITSVLKYKDSTCFFPQKEKISSNNPETVWSIENKVMATNLTYNNTSGPKRFLIESVDRSLVHAFKQGDYIYIHGSNKFKTANGSSSTPISHFLVSLVGNYEIQGAFYNQAGNMVDPLSYTDTGLFKIQKLSVPPFDYAAYYNARIFGVYESRLYMSAKNDVLSFDYLKTESDTLKIETDYTTPFTGMVVFKGMLYLFKEDGIYYLYGKEIDEYEIRKLSHTGCVDGRTISVVGNKVYFLGDRGIYSFDGGKVTLIDGMHFGYCSEGVSGTDGESYYISINDSGFLYIYNTRKNVWSKIIFGNVNCFYSSKGQVFAGCDNGLFALDENKPIWEIETMDIYSEYYNSGSISEIIIRAKLDEGSKLDVSISYDGGPYEVCKTAVYPAKTHISVPIRYEPFQKFSIKINGEGRALIMGIEVSIVN